MEQSHSIKDEGFAFIWRNADWKEIESKVEQMQYDIALAKIEGDPKSVRLHQRILISSFEARMLAVRHVTGPETTKEVGLGEDWVTDADKGKAAMLLNDHRYRADPRQVFVKYEDKSKKDRLMAVPTYYDRAIQRLYLLALSPVMESALNQRSFYSRKGRNIEDACAEVVFLLSGRDAPRWVARCDVKSFYDTINHQWLVRNFRTVDEGVMNEFLDPILVDEKAGRSYRRGKGILTGDQLSPLFGNVTINDVVYGLQDPDDPLNGVAVIWADDILITARTEEDARAYVGHVNALLEERGMALNTDKTFVASVDDGFDFLKYTFKRTGDRVDLYPNKEGILDFKSGIMKICSRYNGNDRDLTLALNNRIKGFSLKYRISDISDVAQELDRFILNAYVEVMRQYLHIDDRDLRSRVLEDGWPRPIDGTYLSRVSDILRIPHPRLCLSANPYVDREYFTKRSKVMDDIRMNGASGQLWNGICRACGLPIQPDHTRTFIPEGDDAGYYHSECTDYRGLRIDHLEIAPRRELKGTPPDSIRNEPVKKEPKIGEMHIAVSAVIDQSAPVIRTESGRRSKYQPLTDYLYQQKEHMVTFTFQELESILGFKLSNSAYKSKGDWYRKGQGTSYAAKSAGWSVESLDLEGQSVTYVHELRRKRTSAEASYQVRSDDFMGAEERKKWEERISKSRYNRLTRWLIDAPYDQLLLSFDKVSEILGTELPVVLNKYYGWNTRRPNSILEAIENGNFEKSDLNMEGRTILITRVWCEPDRSRGDVESGGLRVKKKFASKLIHNRLDSKNEPVS